MYDLKQLMKRHYLHYASYVILDRAIPDLIDGLKPVQRRFLHTLWAMHDGKFHKVANVVGQTMVLHPHGDAAITEALTNMAMKGYLMDCQGNFGNLYTGDPPAASRYIETRLSPMALETMFNPDLTSMLPSYDGRNQEPEILPAKIPLILLQGASGIAVGMSTQILPHNFVELLEAEIAVLEGRPFSVLPDFPTGGIMDATEYNKGRGRIKLRAKLDITDPKTIVIREICYGTTTESLVRSIDEAAKKGKIKIEGINDYTAENVEIEIKLPRGQYAEELVDALYAFTECEVSINSQIMVIRDDHPHEMDVDEIITFHAHRLQDYLQKELEIERSRILQKIFDKTLEQIFIENRLYKKIEEMSSYEAVHQTIEKSLKPYHKLLDRIPSQEDRERLLSIPIRRISRFDIEKNQQDIKALEENLARVDKDLKQIKKVTIHYLKDLIKKYGKQHERKTEIQEIATIDKKAVAMKKVKVSYDSKKGFVGLKVSGDYSFECTNFDKILMMYEDGTYTVSNIADKVYVHQKRAKLVHLGPADKETVFNVIYQDPNTLLTFGKRFAVTQFILDKEYRYFEPEMKLVIFTLDEDINYELRYFPKSKQKISRSDFNFNEIRVKGVSAKGIRLSPKPIKKVSVKKGGSDGKQLDFFETK
ncbi:MAG: DNA topoisomerase IV subunit A [Chlamydiales bacterium]